MAQFYCKLEGFFREPKDFFHNFLQRHRRPSLHTQYFPKNKCNWIKLQHSSGSSTNSFQNTALFLNMCTIFLAYLLHSTISVQYTHPVDIRQSFPKLSCSFVGVQSSLDWFMRGLQKRWEKTSDSIGTNEQNYFILMRQNVILAFICHWQVCTQSACLALHFTTCCTE